MDSFFDDPIASLQNLWAEIFPPEPDTSRGRRWGTTDAALNAISPPQGGERRFVFGGVPLPEGAESTHFLFLGTPGSGKSVLLAALLEQFLSDLASHKDTRIVLNDVKRNMVSWLAKRLPACPIVITDPFDSRASAWAIGHDLTTDSAALQFAATLIPENPSDNNRFFADASRALLQGAVIALRHLRGSDWELRDLLLALSDPAELKKILSSSESTRRFTTYLEASEAASVWSTLQTRLEPFFPIAALWSQAKSQVSLTQFARSQAILILGFDDMNRAALDAINRALLERLSQILLAQPDTDHLPPHEQRRTYILLDEYVEQGKLDSTPALLTRGRSKGVSVSLAFQSIPALYQVYGENSGKAILDQISQKAFLRIEGEETAAWAARSVGDCEYIEEQVSLSQVHYNLRSIATGVPYGEPSYAYQRVSRQTILPSELMTLPPVSKAGGVNGWFLAASVGFTWRSFLPISQFPQRPTQSEREALDFVPHKGQAQELKSWTDGERAELGLG